MFVSIISTFLVALGASFAVPAWSFGGHFFPYTFLVALVLVWGIESDILLIGVIFATIFEVVLGFPLATLSVSFLGIVIAHTLLRHSIDLKPLAHERWNLPKLGLGLVIGAVLWILAIVVSWGMLELVYSSDYPFSAVAAFMKDPASLAVAGGEITVFLILMILTCRQKKSYGTFS